MVGKEEARTRYFNQAAAQGLNKADHGGARKKVHG